MAVEKNIWNYLFPSGADQHMGCMEGSIETA